MTMNSQTRIAGYSYGTAHVARSPVTMDELTSIQASLLFGTEDVEYLRMSYDVLAPHVDAILDVWYGFVGSQPHLLRSFSTSSGQPIAEYLERVRHRFGQWILDTARAEYDQPWLDYQHEIGLRHHRTKKNRTDDVASTPLVPFRDLFALIFPITFTLKPFLAKGGRSQDDVERMYQAWVKSCLLQVTLWSHPYVREGDF
jgi:hypothetical protein